MNGAGIVLDQPTHLSLCKITLWLIKFDVLSQLLKIFWTINNAC